MDLEAEKRFHQLLEKALDLGDDELSAFLDEVGSAEPEYKERLRQALVTLDERMFRQPSGIEEVALQELAFGVPPEELADEPMAIGPYRLIELLGTGGMGRVFLAEQTEPLRRQVALKLLKASLNGREARRRFRAEQQALARLDHPNIGRILEAGSTEDGTPYFAMELVSGEPLIRYCDRQKLSLRERLQLMVAVCRGVEHAHRKQVLHRDLKPSNIMVSEVDGEAVPKIIDFGIAKALDQPLTEATLATGGFLGTPTYMSPEALEGSADLDTRTDVYSLGVLLYELLTGVKPFDVETGGFASLVIKIRQQDTPRPSTRWGHLDTQARQRLAENRQTSVAELNRRLRHELDWVVLKAMAKERDARYGSAAALAEDLQRYLDFQPLLASPPTFSYVFGKLLRRHRLAVGMSLGLLVLGTVGVVYHLRSRQAVSDRTAELTREMERIEWIQRVAYQLPTGDRSAERELIRRGMDRIQSTATALGDLDRGAGAYALGRGAMALRRFDEAQAHLERAWQAGYQRPEVAVTLGLVLSERYERRLERLRLLPDKMARESARREAAQTFRDPAIDMLMAGRQSRVVTPSLLEAHIALLRDDREVDLSEGAEGAATTDGTVPDDAGDDRLARVFTLSEAALAERPWLYEAHFLRARALQRLAAQAAGLQELDRSEDYLRQSEEAVRQGLTIGRSDPDGYLRLCQILGRRLSFIVRHIRPGVDELHPQVVEACSVARQIDSERPEASLTEAGAWVNLAEVKVWDRNEDPAPVLARIDGLLQDSPGTSDHALGLRLLALGQELASLFQMRNGEDPSLAQDKAIALLEEALSLEPNDPMLHERLCKVYSTRGDYAMNRGVDPLDDFAASEHHGLLAVAGAPEVLTPYFYLGAVYVRRAQFRFEHGLDPAADFASGIQRFRQILDKWPSNGPAPNGLANLWILKGRWQIKMGEDPTGSFEAAIPLTNQSLAANPQGTFPVFVRGQAKLWLAYHAALVGRDPSALAAASREDYALGLEKLPNLPGPYVELAELDLAEARYGAILGRSPLDRLQEAAGRARRALEIDAKRADAQRLLAETELLRAAWKMTRGGDVSAILARAREHAEASVRMESGDAEHHLAMVRYAWRRLQAEGRLDPEVLALGLRHCDLADEADPTATHGKVLRGVLMAQDPHQRPEGHALIDEALAENPHLAFYWGDVKR